MTKKRVPTQTEQLFEGFEGVPPRREPRGPRDRVWTANKAQLIQRYTSYFVRVTKHGTYIDGFAGPQEENSTDSWAANLVVRNQPGRESPRLRHFHLFELDAQKVTRLEELRDDRKDLDIQIHEGDFNEEVDHILKTSVIGPKEATFCLLDQRTFECSWTTVERLAAFKGPHKIELFYFLANWWFDRAFKTKGGEELRRWWGRDDHHRLESLKGVDRALEMAKRFQDELGYAYARPFPIYESRTSRRVVFYMIHASDHSRAISLMTNAYDNILPTEQDFEQLALEISE